jgi:hypothetical protein
LAKPREGNAPLNPAAAKQILHRAGIKFLNPHTQTENKVHAKR